MGGLSALEAVWWDWSCHKMCTQSALTRYASPRQHNAGEAKLQSCPRGEGVTFRECQVTADLWNDAHFLTFHGRVSPQHCPAL